MFSTFFPFSLSLPDLFLRVTWFGERHGNFPGIVNALIFWTSSRQTTECFLLQSPTLIENLESNLEALLKTMHSESGNPSPESFKFLRIFSSFVDLRSFSYHTSFPSGRLINQVSGKTSYCSSIISLQKMIRCQKNG